MSKTYTPAQICARFDISKSTLLRWEEICRIPAPERNFRGERRYTEEDIAVIGRVVRVSRHGRRYAQIMAGTGQDAYMDLERLGEENALLKFVNEQDPTGLTELHEHIPLQSETIQKLLQTALDRYDTADVGFWEILDAVYKSSPLSRHEELAFKES